MNIVSRLSDGWAQIKYSRLYCFGKAQFLEILHFFCFKGFFFINYKGKSLIMNGAARHLEDWKHLRQEKTTTEKDTVKFHEHLFFDTSDLFQFFEFFDTRTSV